MSSAGTFRTAVDWMKVQSSAELALLGAMLAARIEQALTLHKSTTSHLAPACAPAT
jgi:hypothetical protein